MSPHPVSTVSDHDELCGSYWLNGSNHSMDIDCLIAHMNYRGGNVAPSAPVTPC